MHYLYTVLASSDLPHKYLKCSNVLVRPDNEPMLVHYGFSHMVNPSTIAQTLFAYKAPEAAQQWQVLRSCAVYCVGVDIIEILTGRFTSQYLSNGNGGVDVVQWVETVISEVRELEVVDPDIAGSRNWLGEMDQLLHIGVVCPERNLHQRLHMAEAVRRIMEIKFECGQQSTSLADR